MVIWFSTKIRANSWAGGKTAFETRNGLMRKASVVLRLVAQKHGAPRSLHDRRALAFWKYNFEPMIGWFPPTWSWIFLSRTFWPNNYSTLATHFTAFVCGCSSWCLMLHIVGVAIAQHTHIHRMTTRMSMSWWTPVKQSWYLLLVGVNVPISRACVSLAVGDIFNINFNSHYAGAQLQWCTCTIHPAQ